MEGFMLSLIMRDRREYWKSVAVFWVCSFFTISFVYRMLSSVERFSSIHIHAWIRERERRNLGFHAITVTKMQSMLPKMEWVSVNCSHRIIFILFQKDPWDDHFILLNVLKKQHCSEGENTLNKENGIYQAQNRAMSVCVFWIIS